MMKFDREHLDFTEWTWEDDGRAEALLDAISASATELVISEIFELVISEIFENEYDRPAVWVNADEDSGAVEFGLLLSGCNGCLSWGFDEIQYDKLDDAEMRSLATAFEAFAKKLRTQLEMQP